MKIYFKLFIIKFVNISLQNGGKLKLHKNGVVFKNNKTGKLEQLNSSDLASVKWMKVAFGYEVKFILNSGTQFKFEGFKESVKHFVSPRLTQGRSVRLSNYNRTLYQSFFS